MHKIFTRRVFRGVAVFLLVNFSTQVIYPLTSLALTSGPSQPEVQSFEPVGTTEMVDLFSGDFTYNIPLFELPGPNGGYPFNLHYNSGVTMDQEASWVGLGWNLNPGAINRQMRGFPDDFKGDPVKREMDVMENISYGGNLGGGLELFGGDLGKMGVSLGIGIYYNNYKGVGYSISPGVNFHTNNQGHDAGLGLGINLSLDSQEGVGVNPSMSLVTNGTYNYTQYSLGANYNSRRGLTGFSMSAGFGRNKRKTGKLAADLGENKVYGSTRSLGGTSSLSMASDAYSPNVGMPMQGRNVSLTFKVGSFAIGVYPNGYVNGYFTTQYLKDKSNTASAYGYMNLQESESDKDLLDFNREKDGMIRKNSPNLPIPSMTHDIYSVTGQGIAGMYRPYRNDVGVLHDQQQSSSVAGGAGGFETGLGAGARWGADFSINYSKTTSGKWTSGDHVKAYYQFEDKVAGSLYEPYYFKTFGEHTSDHKSEMAYIGDSTPVRIKLEDNFDDPSAISKLVKKNGQEINVLQNKNLTETREPRNLTVQPVSNEDLISSNGVEILSEYTSHYFNTPSSDNYISHETQTLSRSGRQKHHTAGITALNPDGTRYVYGIPAYNTKQVECQYSTDQVSSSDCASTVTIDTTDERKPNYKRSRTEQYYNKTTLPEYAHSYLLTAILGADYIDADDVPGPSEGDIGYWVKFKYVKAVEQYKWKVPYNGANYIKGYSNNTQLIDDKAAYIYGEKEVWYLATAETKSHIAAFNISQRKDGRGVSTEFQSHRSGGRDPLGAYSYKLDKITLYARSEYNTTRKSIKTIYFDYTYDLCGNVPNNDGTTAVNLKGESVNAKSGKLTLKRVWFTDQNNTRGALSPYVFHYNETDLAQNPDYHSHKYDRWGNYKPYSEAEQDNICQSIDNPYVSQFDKANPDFKSGLDRNMAVWNLKAITLPSGGTIDIKYESDDYAYVQNKTAMQMFKVTGVGSVNTEQINHSNKRIYFDLETPVADDSRAKSEVQKYMDVENKLFFKARMDLTTSNLWEYVSGYATIADWDVDRSYTDGNGNFTRAYVELGKMTIGGKTYNYHPFSMAAWQHLRTAQPDLMSLAGYKDAGGSERARINGLLSIATEITNMYKGFFGNANAKNWGERIDLTKSFIRLNSPDKIKYGGGVRVKEIVIRDNWSDKTSGGVYGQVYEYTEVENGQTISSGVAAYEPLIGGEEIALRRAKSFSEEIPLQTPNNLYFEYPVNESYYPGPEVGYSKVTVKSIATHYALKAGVNDPYSIASSARTTGQTIHEFYTAREFPVITNETEIDSKPFDLFIPIPFLGQIAINNLTASQGYTIELNDMHGKLKKVSNYAQDVNGVMMQEPSSWVQYNYQHTPSGNGRRDNKTDYFVLNNKVNTLVSDKDGVAAREVRTIGQDYDFFTDMRENRTQSAQGGFNFNSEVIFFGFLPGFNISFWPNIGSAATQLRTAVTNKIIHRSGILKSTEAYDGGSRVKTENKLFDALTGQPVLTTVTNNFDDPIYNYTMPAHLVYDGIGPAYKNIGFSFNATLASTSTASYYTTDTTGLAGKLVTGDEFIVNSSGANPEGRKAIFTKLNGNKLQFYIEGGSFTGNKTFILTRSGRRNHLTASAQSITALSDPTLDRATSTCSTTIKIPKITQRQVIVDTVLSPCSYRNINIINTYLQTAYPTFASQSLNSLIYEPNMPFCFDGEISVEYYISRKTINQLCFDLTSNCTGFYPYTVVISDSIGNPINISVIDSLKNPEYISTPPVTFPRTTYVSVDVKNRSGAYKKGYIEGNLRWFANYQTITKDSIYMIDTTITTTRHRISNVLSASAKRYSDSWAVDNSSLRGSHWSSANRTSFDTKNAYAKGSDGVWRESDSYTYVENRKQSTSVTTRTDGTFDNVPLFNFNNPSNTDCGPNKWRLMNTITDYSIQSAETENKDIQGIYSAALYGYAGGDLVTAVAGNARNSEIAFESFEEFVPNQNINLTNYGTGNLFVQSQDIPDAAIPSYGSYLVLSGNGTAIQVDKPFNAANKAISAEVDGVIYFPYAQQGTKIKGTYNVTVDQADPGNSGNSFIKLDPSQFAYGEVKWKGKVKLKLNASSSVPEVSMPSYCGVVTDYAHTGKNSFLVVSTATFEQKKLNLIPGKNYYYSSWVHNQYYNSFPTYGAGSSFTGIETIISFKDANGDPVTFVDPVWNEGVTAYTLKPSGSMINGWQKLEGRFYVPEGTASVSIQFVSGKRLPNNNYIQTNFDDIRISPFNAAMKTYVYNTTDYKLRAVLDENNYATLYYYDAAGNLFLVKKETERGIQTIQETLGHAKE